MSAKLHVEQRMPIGDITGEARDGSLLADNPGAEEATGTSDVVIVTETKLITVDAKFGIGRVNAYDVLTPARPDILTGEILPEVVRMNLQLALYLLGALRKYGHAGITHVKAIIVQPYLHHVSAYECTVEELVELGEWIKERAESGRTNPVYVPTFDNCLFCRAKLTCKARQDAALEKSLNGFEDVDYATPRQITVNTLGSLFARVNFILDWCHDVQAQVYTELHAGRPVWRNDGLSYKLVPGAPLPPEWSDPAAAEATLKRMRLKFDEMYVSRLATPDQIERLTCGEKPVIGQTQWTRISQYIIQKDGPPSAVLETDPRPALAPAGAVREPVAVTDAGDCSDLF